MGRFSSKFSPLKMAKTAKKLVFGNSQERVSEGRDETEGFVSFEIQANTELVQEKENRKRHRERENEIAVSEGGGAEGEKEIRLFGKNIKIEKGESSKGKKEVERVYTLGDLIRQDKIQTSMERSLAVKQNIKAFKQYTVVTRESLSPGVGLLEGKADNFEGVHVSPSTTISQLFNQFIGCFSPVRVPNVERSGSRASQPVVAVRDAPSSGDFSFVTPLGDLLQPYDAVEEWWPRRASPSLQYSVTSIDPFLERHPIWLQRYQQTLQPTHEAGYGGMSTGNGSGETVTFPENV